MSKQQAGFTLIELVVVIVVLGILAGIAIPKYVDLADGRLQPEVENPLEACCLGC